MKVGIVCPYDWSSPGGVQVHIRDLAVALQRLPIDGAFTGPQVRAALAGRVLGEATFSGTYTLNQRLAG